MGAQPVRPGLKAHVACSMHTQRETLLGARVTRVSAASPPCALCWIHQAWASRAYLRSKWTRMMFSVVNSWPSSSQTNFRLLICSDRAAMNSPMTSTWSPWLPRKLDTCCWATCAGLFSALGSGWCRRVLGRSARTS